MIKKVCKLTSLKKFAQFGTYCFFATAFFLITFSCIGESSKVIDNFKGEEKEVIFSMNIPSADDVTPQLRSIDLTQENTIQRVDLVAFRNDNTGSYFDYYYQGNLNSNKTPGERMQNCRVKVRLASYAQDLVMITNAGTRVSDLINSGNWQNTSKEDFLAKLEYVLPKAGDTWYAIDASHYDVLPMWGETSTTVTQNTTQLSVSLLRMLAKIDVQLDTINSSAIKSAFQIKSVNLYNTLVNGRIAPNSANVRGDSIIAPSLPITPVNYQGPLVYDKSSDFSAPGSLNVAMKNAVYLFETKAPVSTDSLSPLSATCVVIGGLYNADATPSYYRVDFLKNGIFQDILRNHRYVVNITSVTGRGYPTPDEAYRNKAVNMGVTIIGWDDTNSYNVGLK